MSHRKTISVLIPAHNSELTISRALDSILSQSFDREMMEIIVVDDCSQDATWNLIEEFKNKYPKLIQSYKLDVPSGSPSAPRNEALRHASGKYILFMDSDDWLAHEAIEKMLEHAEEWNSDVLLIKLIGENGRDVPISMFTKNQPAVDVYTSKVMWSFAALKLFRRSLIEETDLKFPCFMPEDISFVLRAYYYAKTVSVAADYDYYHVSNDDGSSHTSETTWNYPESNLAAIKDILGFIEEKKINGYILNKTLLRRIFRRDVLNMFMYSAKMNESEGKRYFQQLKDLTKSYYKAPMYKTCPLRERILLDVAFLKDYQSFKRAASSVDHLVESCKFKKGLLKTCCYLPVDVCKLNIDVTSTTDKELLKQLLNRKNQKKERGRTCDTSSPIYC